MVDSRSRSDTTSNIAVIGAGALGSVFASALLNAGNFVTLLGRRLTPDISVCEPPCAIQQTQLRVETDPATISDAKFVLMLVKAYDTEVATRSIAPFLAPESTVITLQNGLGSAERISAHLPGSQVVLSGVTSQAARRVSPGLVIHTGSGPTVIGYRNEVERTRAERVRTVLVNAGIPTSITGDIDRFIWQKVAVNAAINGLTALARVPNGAILSQPPLTAAAEVVLDEATAVAAAHGYDLPGIRQTLRSTIQATAENRSSMLQDVEAGRRTEVDAIYGSLIEAGHERGLALPALTVIDALVRSISRREDTGEDIS
jgi:2-dehydropantoate 2-reductase